MNFKDESKRIHIDWWGQCYTCKHWVGRKFGEKYITDEKPTYCNCLKSPLYKQETWIEGFCSEWDSFDFNTAFKLLQEWELK